MFTKYLITVLSALLLISCGSSADSDTTAIEESVPKAELSTLNVIMNEWDANPDPNYRKGKHIKPGDLKIILTNAGSLEHNLILLNQSDYDELPMVEDGSMVDLSKLDVVGEVNTVQPGSNGEILIENLPAGTYAFICNTAGHYKSGMVGKVISR
tara:strand:+ start:163 stop:627 length:465 start_codon:yes stop_codon:yes gene_type:complete